METTSAAALTPFPVSADESFAPAVADIVGIYDALLARYGVQAWWPADTQFEIVVGAVLTQNTAWGNVEKAIVRMKRADLMSLDAVLASDHQVLSEAVKPSGYYNVKARRLRNLCEFLAAQGGLQAFSMQTAALQREGLLGVNGVGRETADDILLYALDRPVFVIDSYTRRLLQRCGLVTGKEDYETLRDSFESVLHPEIGIYQQYHALIVAHAKAHCRKAPLCQGCCLLTTCQTGSRQTLI